MAQYPEEMRIALQHQFWDLAPGETFFSVTLRFGGHPRSLSIPYAAITHFWDPAVAYQLRFTVPETVQPPAPEPAEDKAADGPNIVSLDHFRKK
jgi:hypothetical protein